MSDTTPGEHGAEFNALVADLRRLHLEKARRDGAANADAIMARAMDLLRAGKLSAADVAFLNAARIRADEQLP